MENATQFWSDDPCFNSYKNCKLKIKLLRVGAHERNNMAVFVLFNMSKISFLPICVLSQCIVY